MVDRNISRANIKVGCEKANFIGKEIKDPYLEKFKIYCLPYLKDSLFNNITQILMDLKKFIRSIIGSVV